MSISNDLRQAVLQAAIQGKLTKQLPEDGNAKDLLEQIKAEKEKLIKESKLKKEKPLPEITDDEKPFDIPENWEWVRIGEICKFNPKNELDDEISVSFIPMACVDDGFNNSHTFEIKKWKDIKKGFSHFANEDIGVAKITPCFQNRKSVIFRNLENGCGAGTTELIVLRANNVAVMPKYLLWFFKSEGFISNGMKSFTGTAGQQRIHKDYLPNCVVPLPTLSEQKRIVAKVEELLAKIDDLEKTEKELEALKKTFPADMKASLLQAAMQGKLTEQLPEDGNAKDLLEQIKAEKAKLIKDGKLKKEKPLPEITEDEIPFDIPENWCVKRMGDVIRFINGRAYKQAELLDDGKYKVLRVGNFFTNDSWYFSDLELEADKYCETGDLLYAWSASFGPRIWNGEKCIYHYHIWKLDYDENLLNKEYLYYYLLYDVMNVRSSTTGTAMVHVSMTNMMPRLIIIPPLTEQKRIVEKLEKLLPLCDGLK